MEDLQPLAAYESASALSFWRTTVVLAVLWGVPMTMFMLRTHQGSLGFVVSIGVIGALIFGSLLTMLARFARRQLTRQVYYCVWPIVPAAPSGDYHARLMCSMMRGRLAVGGHLYVGQDAWAFVPHVRNGPLYRKAVRWERPHRLSLSTQRPRWGWLARLFGAAPSDQLVVADGQSHACFVVPNAADVALKLRGYIGQHA
jgi:uncharacterized membrane protein YeaQ/YmgE (transglycosylase-associated protein family)